MLKISLKKPTTEITLVNQSFKLIQLTKEPLKLIELAGRTCYKSTGKITETSAESFCKMIISKGHDSVLEHASMTIQFVTNRGVTHELVRHRIASFSQESTRYVRYGGKMEFIYPIWWTTWDKKKKLLWINSMENAAKTYIDLLEEGAHPEQAREVLPNSLKTEIVVTANLREWRHIFNLRTSLNAHPQMRHLMSACQSDIKTIIPIIFD